MNNKNSASCTLESAGIDGLSEADVLLNQLLPHPEDATVFAPVKQDSILYKDIRRVCLPNGIRAVRLPDGTTLARSLDRKSGHVFWARVRA